MDVSYRQVAHYQLFFSFGWNFTEERSSSSPFRSHLQILYHLLNNVFRPLLLLLAFKVSWKMFCLLQNWALSSDECMNIWGDSKIRDGKTCREGSWEWQKVNPQAWTPTYTQRHKFKFHLILKGRIILFQFCVFPPAVPFMSPVLIRTES